MPQQMDHKFTMLVLFIANTSMSDWFVSKIKYFYKSKPVLTRKITEINSGESDPGQFQDQDG